MAELTCPPTGNTGFFPEFISPGDAKEEVLTLKRDAAIFNSDVNSYSPREADGSIRKGWSQFVGSWTTWYKAANRFIDDHDSLLENLDSLGVYERAQALRCELIDYRGMFESYGGQSSVPKPRFPEGTKKDEPGLISNLTNLIIVAGVAYVGYQIISSRKK